jgi:hypothetical protein
MILWNKLKCIEVVRSNTIIGYLMKVTRSHDYLATIGEKIEDTELVNIGLNGFLVSWETFVKGIVTSQAGSYMEYLKYLE